ncbi:unnamed protein product [Penicillium viridicatum]
MPRHIPRSRTDSYGFDYITVENNEHQYDFANTDCEFPKFPPRTRKKRTRHIITGLIWTGLVILACLLVIGIGIMVLFAVRTDNTGFDSNSPEYALYKNTMFKDCYNTPLSAITNNCSAIKASLQYQNEVVGLTTPSLSIPNNSNGNKTIYSWCGVISCLNDLKVVPSTPHSSAFWATSLEVWNKAAITFITSFWQLHKLQKALYSDEDTLCKGIEWDTWLIMAWDLASFIWWCFGFGRFAMIPTRYPVPSMLGWVSLWKYCYMLHYHPFDCVLRPFPRRARTARWTLYILATLQWIASVYICVFTWRWGSKKVSRYPAYECLASHIQDAPGTSSCSAEQICSNEQLFKSWVFHYPHQYIDGYVSLASLVLGLSFIAIVMICSLGAFPLIASMVKGGSPEKWRKRASGFDFGFAGSIGLAGVACILIAALTGYDAVQALDRPREGAIAFNWECNALHVTVSSWRYYLDVDYELLVRAARMWFNS